MLLSAHQPTYLPWLGLFHKIAVADIFVVYDDVPYSRYGWYNRNTILASNGPLMLTVPIFRSRKAGTNHNEVRINNDTNWRKKHWRSIHQAYRNASFFGDYAPAFEEIYATDWERLVDLNLALLALILGFLGIETPVRLASKENFDGAKSDRALDMSTKLNADALLFGALGREYAELDNYKSEGVVALFQDYVHPTYEQARKIFRPSMGVIDLLFFQGPKSRDILLRDNLTRDDYLAQAAEVRASW